MSLRTKRFLGRSNLLEKLIMETTVIVGVLTRIEPSRAAAIASALATYEGVSTFPLEPAEKLGVLIEAADLDSAHARITQDIRHTPGVLGCWPVSAEFDSDPADPTDAAVLNQTAASQDR